MKTLETDVLVVGAGPTGMTAATLLARHGLDCLVVDKRPGPRREPAAHAINARSFEIWRQAGVDVDRLRALASDPGDAGLVHWVTRLGGEVLGSLPYERQGDEVLAFTPTPLRNLAQHRLEPVLASEVERVAGRGPRWGVEWEGGAQDADGVTTTLRDLATGEPFAVRSRFVVAADGAGSPVRKSLGIRPLGPDRIQAFVMIHFEADLRALLGDRPGVLYWVSDPTCSGVFVAHDIRGEWVFMHSWDPDTESRDSYDEERCTALVRAAIVAAGADVPIAIRTISPWMMTSQVAERWRDGRVFLAGDAAHRFPPTGGLGLNSGVQDAHNLAWKLAAVLRGHAGDALLDTYEAERSPVAHANASHSLANAMKMLEVPQAMGTIGPVDEASRSFEAMLADPRRRDEVAAAIANQATHFDMLGLQLGYAYAGAAVEDDGSEPPAVGDPVRDFVPTARPGSRLPHGWIRGEAGRRSTLDLVDVDRWSLLAPRGSAWVAAANSLAFPLRVVEWGVDVVDDDAGADWWSGVAGLGADGALLVRPDQHVAARLKGSDAEDAAARLRDVLTRLLAA